MLFETPPLGDSERRVIEQIDELKRLVGHLVSGVPRRWFGLLRRTAFARAVRGSNSIEGYEMSLDDTIAVAEGEEPLDPNAETRAAVSGYQSAMTYVLQLADDPHFSYSADLLRSLHFMMLQHKLVKNPGRWRLGQIFVHDDERSEVVYEGPNAELVPNLVQELIGVLNDAPMTEPSVVRGAMAHLNLVMIHPFADGNGRMARCLQTLVLARGGTLAAPFSSIEEYLGRNTRAYYEVLAEVGGGSWNPQGNASPWIRFCLTAHLRQATTVLRRSQELERLWNELEELVKAKSLPERTIFALVDAAHGLRIRNATYRTVAEISENLASRDLKILVDRDLLVAAGEKRGRFYRASESLRAIRERTRLAKRNEDPFAREPGPPAA